MKSLQQKHQSLFPFFSAFHNLQLRSSICSRQILAQRKCREQKMNKLSSVKETYILHTLNPKPLESLEKKFQSQRQRNNLLDTKEHVCVHKDWDSIHRICESSKTDHTQHGVGSWTWSLTNSSAAKQQLLYHGTETAFCHLASNEWVTLQWNSTHHKGTRSFTIGKEERWFRNNWRGGDYDQNTLLKKSTTLKEQII